MTLFDPSATEEAIDATSTSVALRTETNTCRIGFGLSYDGGGFHGFAPQPRQRTVAGALYGALSQLLGSPVVGVCAGRTDVGVHATFQIVHVDCDAAVLSERFSPQLSFGDELPKLARALSSLLSPEIVVWKAVVVGPDFDARHSAVARRYRYLVDAKHSPLRRTISWQLDQDLDLALVHTATEPLVGEHDFAAFCRRPADRPDASLVRRVLDAQWYRERPGEFVFEIEANAFCHQMVRSVVGALVAVGTGRLSPRAMVGFLGQSDRENMPMLAPAQGLCLIAVRYPAPFGTLWSAE